MSSKKYQLRIRSNGYRYSYGFYDTPEDLELGRVEVEKRLYKEEKMGHIIGTMGEVLKTRFKVKDVNYDIIGTQYTGKGKFDAIDFVKNADTKEIKEIQRQKLFDLTRNQ